MRRLSLPRSFNAISIIVVLSAAGVFLLLPRAVPSLVKTFDYEGGSIELLSALFYLGGFLICVYRIVTKAPHHRPYLYLWAILCFLFLGEETSWLQHFIGYGTPASIRDINVQDEFNIHNLFDAGSWHEAVKSGNLDYKLFLNTTMIFRLGFFSYFLLVPILIHAGWSRRLDEKLRFPLPSVGFVVTVAVTLSLSFLGYYWNQELRMELTEAREMYYAAFIMFYALFFLGTEGLGRAPRGETG